MSDSKFEYGTDFLYAEDLLQGGQFQTVKVQISEVIEPGTIRAANGKPVDKWILRFAGKSKQLAMCDTNMRLVHLITGHPPGSAWIGKTITLQVRVVEAFGDNVIAVRVIPAAGTPLRKSLLKRLGSKAVFKSEHA
jgi:hypothetical protein